VHRRRHESVRALEAVDDRFPPGADVSRQL
jgi:hypothetical protein